MTSVFALDPVVAASVADALASGSDLFHVADRYNLPPACIVASVDTRLTKRYIDALAKAGKAKRRRHAVVKKAPKRKLIKAAGC